MKTLFLDPNPDSHKDLELIPETGSLMLPSYMVVLRKLRKEPPWKWPVKMFFYQGNFDMISVSVLQTIPRGPVLVPVLQ
jgi:hypothetical protein